MGDQSDNLWYQLGYALEEVRSGPTRERVETLRDKLGAFRAGGQASRETRGGTEVTTRSNGDGASSEKGGSETLDWIIGAVSGGATAQVLRHWHPRSRPGPGLLVRALASGAAASLIQALVAVLLADEEDEVLLDGSAFLDRLFSGSVRGLLYAAVAEPRLPGPPILRGAIYGTVEYLLAPMGGVSRVLGRESPWGRLPVLRSILDSAEIDEDHFVEHLVFGAALALMAGETVGAGPDGD